MSHKPTTPTPSKARWLPQPNKPQIKSNKLPISRPWLAEKALNVVRKAKKTNPIPNTMACRRGFHSKRGNFRLICGRLIWGNAHLRRGAVGVGLAAEPLPLAAVLLAGGVVGRAAFVPPRVAGVGTSAVARVWALARLGVPAFFGWGSGFACLDAIPRREGVADWGLGIAD